MKLNSVLLQKMSSLCCDVAHLRRELITVSITDVDVLSIHAIFYFPFVTFWPVAGQRVTLSCLVPTVWIASAGTRYFYLLDNSLEFEVSPRFASNPPLYPSRAVYPTVNP